jgi:hypothetical protein
MAGGTCEGHPAIGSSSREAAWAASMRARKRIRVRRHMEIVAKTGAFKRHDKAKLNDLLMSHSWAEHAREDME